ncbi:MAG: cysteine--tRNA ligase [Chloroflexi bacterium]|nr:cysteine--tRNA ligase [Chloroflexota bacterium]
MKVFNTLSGQKEEFTPQGEVVKMYVCGVTPYSECHVGHAMSYVAFDVVRRYLEFRGYRVKHVQNFTDIDDKIIDRANQQGIPPSQLAERFIAEYFTDMDALNVRRASVHPRATQEIPKIIEVIQGLMDKGHAYEADGTVYFRVKSDPDYGKLSHQNLDGLQAGARVEVGTGKDHPLDFALWKAAKPGEPWWDSPWGRGRPGWHIECTAMSLRHLGETLDIHGGGQDLIFPHHENEIAQSESFTGVAPFVRYWMHNGFVKLGEVKMSKSLGNLVTIKDILSRFSPDAVRLFILSSHYRSPISFGDDGLEAAEKGVERLRLAARVEGKGESAEALDIAAFRQGFITAMDDDFNTAQAIAWLFDLVREVNRTAADGADVKAAQQTLLELCSVLGLTLKDRETTQSDRLVIESMVTARSDARKQRNWQEADRIRAGLEKMGIVVEDTPQGSSWRRRSA